MKERDRRELDQLIQRGQMIISKIENAKLADVEALGDIVEILGEIGASLLDEDDRDLARAIADTGTKLLKTPLAKVRQEYVEWSVDCRGFFARMNWMHHSLVRAFMEIGSYHVDQEPRIAVQMLIAKQIEILRELREAPPRTWHVAKAGIVIVLTAVFVFLDVVLFALIGFAAIPVAAFQVAFLTVLPRIERWIREQ